MGNCGLAVHSSPYKQLVVKLVHSNGLVEEFYRPMRAGELTVDYPDHFICHADNLSQLMIGNSHGLLGSLSDDDDMEIGQIYFLLPKRVLDSPLTHTDVTELISKASIARKASYKGSQLVPLPLPARRSSYNSEDEDDEMVRPMSREFVQHVIAEARLELQKRAAADPLLSKQLGSNPELQSAFTNHIVAKSCARLWKPPLDTIYEDPAKI